MRPNRRYYVEIVNIYPRPFRVIDGHKGTILLQSGDKELADSLADQYENEWQSRPGLIRRLLPFLFRSTNKATEASR
jgi:hypothetical protein